MVPALYSLEKLIEWKRSNCLFNSRLQGSLYSLEKLIEWKREDLSLSITGVRDSLLAREIN